MGDLIKIEVVTRPGKLEDLKDALAEIGITGMTVTQVYGCGSQKGHTEVYRGTEYAVNLLPKVKVETVVKESEMKAVMDVMRNTLRTGKLGDGKIFVYPIQNAIRIRTGEEGTMAVGEKKE